MSFKDIYEKYINGNATEEEIKYIEEELEKNEFINEVLAQKLDEDILNLVGEKSVEATGNNKLKDDSILKEVNKAVRKKLVLTGICSVLVVILLGIGAKYIVSPLMNLYYYNPTEKVGETSTRFKQDFSFFTELHYPGLFSEYVGYQSLGYGEYRVDISQAEMFRNTCKIYTGEIKRGKLMDMPLDFYRNELTYSFNSRENPDHSIRNDDKELSELKSMANTAVAQVTISFEKDMDMEQLYKLFAKYCTSLRLEWVAIRTYPTDAEPLPMMGFYPYNLSPTDGVKDDERYADIQIGINKDGKMDYKTLERHFKSLLKYMVDNEKFVSLLKGRAIDSKLYEGALDYVKTNGVKSYAILVSGKPEEILKLREEIVVSNLWINDVKISDYSK